MNGGKWTVMKERLERVTACERIEWERETGVSSKWGEERRSSASERETYMKIVSGRQDWPAGMNLARHLAMA